MDIIRIYKDKLDDLLSLVTSMSSLNKLEAIELWNSAAAQFQGIVNSNEYRIDQLSHGHGGEGDHDGNNDDNDIDDHHNHGIRQSGINQSDDDGLVSPHRREEFSTPALDSPPASQRPAEGLQIVSESSQHPDVLSSMGNSFYGESFRSPQANMMDDEPQQQANQRGMNDEQMNESSLSVVPHNYFSTCNSVCSNSRSQITTTDAQDTSNRMPFNSIRSMLQSTVETNTTNHHHTPQIIGAIAAADDDDDESEQSISQQSQTEIIEQGCRFISCEADHSQSARSHEMSHVSQSRHEETTNQLLEQAANNSLSFSNFSVASGSNEQRHDNSHQQSDLRRAEEIARLANILASPEDQPIETALDHQPQSLSSTAVPAMLCARPDQTVAQQINTSIHSILGSGFSFNTNYGDSNATTNQQYEANHELQRLLSMANSSNFLTSSASAHTSLNTFDSSSSNNNNSQQVANTDEVNMQCSIDVPKFDPRTGRELHTCDLCGKTGFSTKGNLKRHRNAHSGEKPYKCDHCESRFTEKKSLKIHIRKHTGEKPYKCEVCDKVFSQTGVLKSHMAVHNEHTRKYKCSVCPKVFRQNSQLSIHLKRHEGVRNLDCSTCDAKFLTKGDLQRHFRTHTGERPYACETCGKRFTRQQSLNEHMNRHAGRKPHACKFCGRTFSEMSACYKHTKTHKLEVVEPHDMLDTHNQSQGIPC